MSVRSSFKWAAGILLAWLSTAFVSGCAPRAPLIDFRDKSFRASGADGAGIRLLSGGEVSIVPAGSLDIDDAKGVLRFVLEHCAPRERVHLTERYFYYNFVHGCRMISGNLRFTDAESGVVHIGYFDKYDRDFLRSGTFGKAEGIRVDCHENETLVSFGEGGPARRFSLRAAEGESASLPETLAERGWIALCKVSDDSGHEFVLGWHDAYETFAYFGRDLDAASREPLALIPDTTCSLGMGSRYVFMPVCEGWSVLAGVCADEIQRNSYFDGPFDQVPPKLFLKARIAAAYPYVLAGAGTDDYGNFIEQAGQRVAVSPYQQYDSTPEFAVYFAQRIAPATTPDERIARACFEAKKLAHLRLPDVPLPHRAAVSGTWPANHHGDTSRSDGAARTKAPDR